MQMDELVAAFPAQLRDAVRIGREISLRTPRLPIHNVVVTGLGGSGIGGTMLTQLMESEIGVPLVVNKDYRLPAFVGAETLVIVSSYSGNTEETLSALKSAIASNAHIVCVCSGGTVAEMAREHNLDLVLIPSGMPPRSCLGYSFVQLVFILCTLRLTSTSPADDLLACADLLEREHAGIDAYSTTLASALVDKLPVLYSEARYEGVAVRWRQQINENGKMLCWHHVLPEMNHNELVGWTVKHPDAVVVMLRNSDDHARTQHRMDFTRGVVEPLCAQVIEVVSKGETHLQRMLYLVHLGDWLSVKLAALRKIDAMEVKVIDRLKSELANRI
jgi:glucose/mannose-6-phosphate isomerase